MKGGLATPSTTMQTFPPNHPHSTLRQVLIFNQLDFCHLLGLNIPYHTG
jgi:hypothetical protein